MDDGNRVLVDLPADLVHDIDEAVATGSYASREEAIRLAIEAFEVDKSIATLGAQRLRELIRAGSESGPDVDGEEVFEQLAERYERLARERGE